LIARDAGTPARKVRGNPILLVCAGCDADTPVCTIVTGRKSPLRTDKSVCLTICAHACLARDRSQAARLSLRKVILIRPLEHIRLAGGDADAVVDHQFGEALAVDEDDLLGDLVDELAGTGGSRAERDRLPSGCPKGERGGVHQLGRGDEDAFVRLVGGEGTDEFAERPDAHIAFPALGLHIDGIQAEVVFIDHVVDAAVARGFGAFIVSAYENKNGLTLTVSL